MALPDSHPLVSVVLACSTQGHLLRDAIVSLVGSSYRQVELVVADGGPTGDTAGMADGFGQAIYCWQPNAGLVAARNLGLRASHGEFVVFVDEGTRLAPDGLEAGVDALVSHPLCEFAVGRCQTLDRDGNLRPAPWQPRVERDHYRALLRRNFIWTPAMVLFRRRAVERAGGFNPGAKTAADYELYLKIARAHPVVDHGHVVAYYERRATYSDGHRARLLHEILAVHRDERLLIEGDRASIAAHRDGLKASQTSYATYLLNEIRRQAAAGDWASAALTSAVLGWNHPRALVQHAHRHVSMVVKRMLHPRYGRPAIR
jgi:glycosyltransferase involved in cell wall biosynthesis